MPRKTYSAAAGAVAAAGASMRPRPDAAENRIVWVSPTWKAECFNEAAARCRGKRGQRSRRAPRSRSRFNEAAARCRGKLVTLRTGLRRRAGFNEAAARCRGKPQAPRDPPPGRGASMRPRPDAAENAAGRRDPLQPARQASMRPRPDAAENTAGAQRRGPPMTGFNEAAARCRGKQPGTETPGQAARPASMRPRPDAAENSWEDGTEPARSGRFNEAAARCRGKPVTAAPRIVVEQPAASMRPRPDAAENM